MINEERFWAKVQKTDGCWLWTASVRNRGYGMFSVNRRNCQAHRVSWELAYGPIPDGLHVCHRCDNVLCVRPDHLWLGTNHENHLDKVRKGRWGPDRAVVGERHGSARLTEEAVRIIRRERTAGALVRDLASRFGVSKRTIYDVSMGQTWSHLND